jgi:hypothetical protein
MTSEVKNNRKLRLYSSFKQIYHVEKRAKADFEKFLVDYAAAVERDFERKVTKDTIAEFRAMYARSCKGETSTDYILSERFGVHFTDIAPCFANAIRRMVVGGTSAPLLYATKFNVQNAYNRYDNDPIRRLLTSIPLDIDDGIDITKLSWEINFPTNTGNDFAIVGVKDIVFKLNGAKTNAARIVGEYNLFRVTPGNDFKCSGVVRMMSNMENRGSNEYGLISRKCIYKPNYAKRVPMIGGELNDGVLADDDTIAEIDICMDRVLDGKNKFDEIFGKLLAMIDAFDEASKTVVRNKGAYSFVVHDFGLVTPTIVYVMQQLVVADNAATLVPTYQYIELSAIADGKCTVTIVDKNANADDTSSIDAIKKLIAQALVIVKRDLSALLGKK